MAIADICSLRENASATHRQGNGSKRAELQPTAAEFRPSMDIAATYLERTGIFLLFPDMGGPSNRWADRDQRKTKDGSNEKDVGNCGRARRSDVRGSRTWRRIWWRGIRLFAGAFFPDEWPGLRHSWCFRIFSRPSDAYLRICHGTPGRIGLCARQDQALVRAIMRMVEAAPVGGLFRLNVTRSRANYPRTSVTPVMRHKTPIPRSIVIGCRGKPKKPNWSKASELSN